MQNTKLLLTSLTFAGLVALAGCSFPGVYKVDIQQGNVVTQDMIDQLRPGMTRRQVRFIMGSPLITDTFHANRWDYVYSIQPGGSRRQQERMSLIFSDNDQLIGLSGDFVPGVSRDEAILGTDGSAAPATQAPSQAEPAPAPGSLEEQIQREVDEAEAVPVPSPEPLDTNPQ
ncbi:outer membrane protein assembly factor BamE [Stutzerimonas azotifigens]|uniref:Outer membrane protein assembly factor BamE n=1 Tax=Stutzerimonas azotifigens TaxID=291995 RepID=A0ABR5Z583_9GAMM|nr:outer membrane protein assembly factor BamE [Stutzerimonas azotifigens]MBA1275295.1 outer membrane protein assembly factor BamE [Stutzerimonas azotifigens]